MDLLEPILDENRMCVEYRHVSAYVPATVAAGGFFSGWELPKWSAKAKAKEKAKLRRVRQLPYTYQLCNCPSPNAWASKYVLYKPGGILLPGRVHRRSGWGLYACQARLRHPTLWS